MGSCHVSDFFEHENSPISLTTGCSEEDLRGCEG
uniref:Uncharacterized protein n=1 Tax=Anguilla anguilla TaxID=7936 RepID=A0A0E9PXS0_ANGAN